MAKKSYNKGNDKPKVKDYPICEGCLTDTEVSELKNWDFYWVDRGGYYSISCKDCILIEPYPVVMPYRKKPGKRKKVE